MRPNALSVAILFGIAGHALAQTTQDTTMALEPITVIGQAATRTDTPLIETPQSVTRIDADTINKRDVQSVQRATDYSPGIFSNQVGASSRYDYLVMRGFSDGSLGNVLLDGMKVLGDTSSFSSLRIDPWFLENMEVVRGPASVLYGQGSPGGLVALQSKKPQFTPQRTLRFQFGNRKQLGAAFDFTGPIGEDQRLAWRLTGKAQTADTQFDHVKQSSYALAPSLTWEISDDTSLTLNAYLQKEPHGGYHSGVPYEGSVIAHNGKKIAPSFFDGEPDYDRFKRNEYLFGYSLEHYFNDDWKARQQVRYLKSDVELEQVYGYGWVAPDSDQLNHYYAGADESLKSWTIDNQIEGTIHQGNLSHKLLFGLDYQHRKNNVSWLSGAFPPIDAFNPTYGSKPVAMYPPTNEQHHLQQLGIYAQDQMQLDRWHFVLGARHDWIKIRNHNPDTDETSTLDDTQFSGRAALLYQFDNGISPYISYSSAFTPTSFTDEQGDILKPMKGRQWEAGIKYQQPGSQNYFSVAAFDIEQRNVATKEQPTDPYRAIGEIHSRGIELEANAQITPEWQVQGGYTYTDITYAKSDDGNQGNNARYAPRHQAQLWATYQPSWLSNADFGLGVRHYSGIPADSANTYTLPSYSVVDASIGYDLGKQLGLKDELEVRINANNLLNKTYTAACNSLEFCYFGAKRNISASFSYRF